MRWTGALVVSISLLAIALIAVMDRTAHAQMSFGLLYLVPVVFASTVLQRWQVPVLGAVCTFVAELGDAFPWTVQQGIPRDALYLAAYTAAGLYVRELLSKRRVEHAHLEAVQAEVEARSEAEEQLKLLVASSSIAIVTSDEVGVILQANDAAERLLEGEEGKARLCGAALVNYLPSLARVPIGRKGAGRGEPRQFRTMMQCQGVRAGGEPFLADIWFSTYATKGGGRMTSMIVDSSMEMRDREEANLEQVLVGSRLLVGAVSHEIRNVCAAIALVQENLAVGDPGLERREDFVALRQLVTALERMASVELSHVKRQTSPMELTDFFRDLRIIVTPSLREKEIGVEWVLEEELPEVWADQQSLMQVFLNLLRNAEHALEDVEGAKVRISARRRGAQVEVRVADNGRGVERPEVLFRPFQARAGETGLGLYLSRAMMNSFRGDLRYEGGSGGAVFVMELMAAEV